MYDIVYTYVNGDDPSHVQSKQHHMKVCAPDPESSHTCRFQSSCEIVYSLYSIFMFANHNELRNIYVVISDNDHQTISFDAIRNDDFVAFLQTRLQYIFHSQIIPLEYLPTFNSHVIELYLSRIPNLLEMFVYFNDDCFLGAPVTESFWFTQTQTQTQAQVQAHIFSSNVKMKPEMRLQSVSMFQSIMNKTADLLQQRLRMQSWHICHHQAKPLLTSICTLVLKDPVFANAVAALSSRKFRTRQDFAPIELMVAYMYGVRKGKLVNVKPCTFYMEWTHDETTMNNKFNVLLQKSPAPQLICINDVPPPTPSSSPLALGWKSRLLAQFAQQYYVTPTHPRS